MENLKKNREFIVRYFNALSGVEKTVELCNEFMTDTELREHIIFFDGAFPKYDLFIEEMIAEGNKIMVRARFTGTHINEFNGIPPTNKSVDVPLVVRYTIENNLITDHWLIADQVLMMEQLGVMEPQTTAH